MTASQDAKNIGLTNRMRRRQKRRGWLVDEYSGDRLTTLRRKIGLRINAHNTFATLTEETAPGVIWSLRTFVIESSAIPAIEKALREIRSYRDSRADAEDLILAVLNDHGIELPLGLYTRRGTDLPHAHDLSQNLAGDARDQFIHDERQREQDRNEQLRQLAHQPELAP